MGFRGNNKNTYRPKLPKGPIRLAFGIINEDKNEQKPIIAVQPTFEKQEIIGTLILKKFDLSKTKPLTDERIERIKLNLKKIYEEGRYLNTNTIIDEENGILKISFNYNQNTIDRIKGFDRNERQWDPDAKVWKVFVGCFDDLFDILGKGFKITENAFECINNFIDTKYYANIAPSKLGKLILRESWFEEFDLNSEFPNSQSTNVLIGSSASLNSLDNKHLEEVNSVKSIIEKFSFKRKPYSHQILGIEFLLLNPACALLDEMGCGKSFQIASSIAMLLETKKINKCLIVAPKSLIKTWTDEVSLATNIPFTVIEGTPAQRNKLLLSDSQIFIVHYEGIRLEKEKLSEWIKDGEGMIVFDESQRIKNLNAITTVSAKYIRNSAKRCVIATGTPISNRPLDLFSQYYVMDNGQTFGSSFQAFKNTFCYIDIIEINQGRRKVKIEKFMGIRNGEELRKRIQATSLRRLKSEVLDLPPIIYKDYNIELRAEQKSIYAKMRDNVRNEIENMSPEEYSMQANNIVVRLLRLSQIASNPLLIDKNYSGSNAKLTELDEVLNDVFDDETKKVILWSHFVDNVTYLQELYSEKWGAVSHTGEMKTQDKNFSVEEFQNNPNCRLFIATPQSAKEGLTLLPKDGKMKADTMIYLDLNFDGGSYVQSQARFHRIGQNSDKCLVIHMIGLETVDEYIKKSLIDKIQTATQILDDASQEELNRIKGDSFNISRDELLNIL